MKKVFWTMLMVVTVPLWCVGETPKQQEIGKTGLTAPARIEQCWAVTKSGNRCKRRAVAGERYCRQHSAAREPKTAPERCRSMTTNGVQCAEKTAPKSSYCAAHLK